MAEAEEKENTENTENPEGGEAAEGGEAQPKKKMSGKKLVLFIVAPLVLVGAIVGGLFAAGVFGHKKEETVEVAPPKTPSIYYQMPELLVNLNTKGRRSNFLKIIINLELGNQADVATIEHNMPKIIDSFQVYLREVRIEDLKGSGAIYRLREELLRRVSIAVYPVEVRDVLFLDMVTQ